MAYLLDDSAASGDGQWFTREFSGSWAAAIPISMSIWFYTDDLAISQNIISYQSITGGTGDYIRIMYNTGASELRAQHFTDDDGTDQASVSFSSANSWHHAAAIFRSNSYRAIFLDGSGTTASESTLNSNPLLERQNIGKLVGGVTSQPMSGGIAEAAIWVNYELTNDQVDSLAAGISPMLVYPQAMSYYWPGLGKRDPFHDWSSKETAATAEHQNLSPSDANIAKIDHPGEIIYPWNGIALSQPVDQSILQVNISPSANYIQVV